MSISIMTPLTEKKVASLRAGDTVKLSGIIYTARDAAHKRMYEANEKGEPLPIDLTGQVIYYVGPTPPKPDQQIGSAGPTTSERMDKYTPLLLEIGLKGMIGKGYRNKEVKKAIKRHRAVYLAAIGGTGALISQCIKRVEIIAYADLGPEAIHRLEVEDMPLIVINDMYGQDYYEIGQAAFREKEG